jgi:hypothetical protein
MEKGHEWLIQQAQVLLDRLERLSADSVWAHKASGLRGSIIRSMDDLDKGEKDHSRFNLLLQQGFHILSEAAREIPDNR